LLPLFGVAAIAVSLLALRELRARPKLAGRGRAYFGLFMGVLTSIVYVPLVVLGLIGAMLGK
jgi:hypothetical protein